MERRVNAKQGPTLGSSSGRIGRMGGSPRRGASLGFCSGGVNSGGGLTVVHALFHAFEPYWSCRLLKVCCADGSTLDDLFNLSLALPAFCESMFSRQTNVLPGSPGGVNSGGAVGAPGSLGGVHSGGTSGVTLASAPWNARVFDTAILGH
jgi:hypothetical protein